MTANTARSCAFQRPLVVIAETKRGFWGSMVMESTSWKLLCIQHEEMSNKDVVLKVIIF